MEIALTITASVAAGILIGILSGLLGVGGGTILVPIYKLAYGMSAVVSTATSLFTIIPTSLSGALTHVRNKTCIPSLGIAAGIGGALLSPVGVWLANVSPEWTVMLAAAIVIGYSSITMFRKAFKLRAKVASSSAAESTEESVETPKEVHYMVSIKRLRLTGGAIGLVAGVVSGYVGVGGGFIMVPMFMSMLGIPMRLASGTSLIAVLILAVPGVITQAVLGNVDWMVGAFMALGTIPGAIVGSRLVTRVPEVQLRFGFAAFLVVAAALLLVEQLGVL